MTNHASILGKASVVGSAPCAKNIDDGQSNDFWGKKKNLVLQPSLIHRSMNK
jgi:hypothetical protein